MEGNAVASDVLRLRIDPDLKAEANKVAQAMGLSLSDAVRMFLVRFVAEKRFPFVPEVPHKETQEQMKNASSGKITTVSDSMS